MDITITIANVDPQFVEAAARGLGWQPTITTQKSFTNPVGQTFTPPTGATNCTLQHTDQDNEYYICTVEEPNPQSALDYLSDIFRRDFLARAADAAAQESVRQQLEQAQQAAQQMRQQLEGTVQVSIQAQ